MTGPTLLRMVAALLLVTATSAFVAGVSVERAAEHEEAVHEADVLAATNSEASAEYGEEREAAETHAEEGAEGAELNEGSDAILGIDPKSPGSIALAVVLSLLLAVAMWLRDTPAVLVVTAAFALLFAALDVWQALHLSAESRDGLVTLILLSAALHGGVAIASSAALRERPTNTLPVART